jgi:hypothetical protein
MLIIGCDFHTRYQQIAMAGGRALIPKTAPGWRTLWGLVFQRVRKLTVLHGSFFSLSGRFFTSLGTTSSDLLHFP